MEEIIMHDNYCNNILQSTCLRNVVQFKVMNWSSNGSTVQPQMILDVIEGIIRVQQKIGGGPVVVHCR